MAKNIVIVCKGNIARSPIAEFFINQEISKKGLGGELSVTSRGIQGTSAHPAPTRFPNITHYDDLYHDLGPLLEKHKIDLSSRKSTPVSGKDMQGAALVLAMDENVKNQLTSMFPKESKKVVLFSSLADKEKSVTDPDVIAGTKEREEIFLEIKETAVNGFDKLAENIKKL